MYTHPGLKSKIETYASRVGFRGTRSGLGPTPPPPQKQFTGKKFVRQKKKKIKVFFVN
jgi:hypothetical protein